jgi:hypothetical protein
MAQRPLKQEVSLSRGIIAAYTGGKTPGLFDVWNGHVADDGTLIRRDGFQGLTAATGTTIQHITQFDRSNGTRQTVGIIDGAIYTYNWSTNVWAQQVSNANIVTAGGALDTSTSNVYTVILADQLIISDGTNVPIMWNGATGAGSITNLANCPVLYGQPVIYYAKLFGIKSTERTAIVWSEENDPTTGYEAGGFNNSWTLAQTGTQILEALAGTNQALFFWRRDSIGQIRGAVTTTFVSDGVVDGVSNSVGTQAVRSIFLHENKIYFVDQLGRPRFFFIGGTDVQDLSAAQLEAAFSNDAPDRIVHLIAAGDFSDLDTDNFAWTKVFYVEHLDMIGFWYQQSGASGVGDLLLFDERGRYRGRYDPPTGGVIQQIAPGCYDSINGREVVLFTLNDETTWGFYATDLKQDVNTVPANLTYQLIALYQPMHASEAEKMFDILRAHVTVYDAESGGTMTYGLIVPEDEQGNSASVSAAITLETGPASGYKASYRHEVGFGAYGTWAMPYFTSHTTRKVRVLSLNLTAYETAPFPGAE